MITNFIFLLMGFLMTNGAQAAEAGSAWNVMGQAQSFESKAVLEALAQKQSLDAAQKGGLLGGQQGGLVLVGDDPHAQDLLAQALASPEKPVIVVNPALGQLKAKNFGLNAISDRAQLGFVYWKQPQEVVVNFPAQGFMAEDEVMVGQPALPSTQEELNALVVQWLDAVAKMRLQDGVGNPPKLPEVDAQALLAHSDYTPLNTKAQLSRYYKANKINNWEYSCENSPGHWTINTYPSPAGTDEIRFRGGLQMNLVWMRSTESDAKNPESHQLIMTAGITLEPQLEEFNQGRSDESHRLWIDAPGTGYHRDLKTFAYPYLLKGFSVGVDFAAELEKDSVRSILKPNETYTVPKAAVRDTQFQYGNSYSKKIGSSWTVNGSVYGKGGKSSQGGSWEVGGEVGYSYTSFNEENWEWNSSEAYTRQTWEGGARAIVAQNGGDAWDHLFGGVPANNKWYFHYYGNDRYPFAWEKLNRGYEKSGTEFETIDMNRGGDSYKMRSSVDDSQAGLQTFWVQKVWQSARGQYLPAQNVVLKTRMIPMLGAAFMTHWAWTECYHFKPQLHLDYVRWRAAMVAAKPIDVNFQIDFANPIVQPAPKAKAVIYDVQIAKTKDPLYYQVTLKVKATPELRGSEDFLTHIVILPKKDGKYVPPVSAIRNISAKKITVRSDNDENKPVVLTFEAQNMGTAQPYSAAFVIYQIGNGQGHAKEVGISGS